MATDARRDLPRVEDDPETATPADLSALAELASQNGFWALGRVVGVISNWSQSGQVDRTIPASYGRDAATDLEELLAKLPKLYDYDSEIEFVVGYQPIDLGLLPDSDAREVVAWHTFHHQAARNALATDRDEPEKLSEQWIPLVHELARFVATRGRIATARQRGRDRRKQQS